MKSYHEMRQEAWKTATSQWTFRYFTLFLFFAAIMGLVMGLMGGYFHAHDIVTWEQFMKSQQEIESSGVDFAVPSMHDALAMTWASSFEGFVKGLLEAIMLFGFVAFALKAVRNQHERWLGAAFSGFKAPFGMLWLSALMGIKIFLWTLLFIIPGIIAMFRYALAWYVKADNPEFSASRCLDESSRLMDGYKWRLVIFGLSFWPWYLLFAALIILTGALATFLPVWFTGAAAVVTMVYAMFLIAYMVFGQAVFYTEVKRISETPNTENSTADASAAKVES